MKRVVVTLCAWFSFMCAWSLSPDLVPEDFSSFKNTQYRYSDHDKILIPSDGEIIQTIVQPNYLVENGNLSLARSEYEMIARVRLVIVILVKKFWHRIFFIAESLFLEWKHRIFQ